MQEQQNKIDKCCRYLESYVWIQRTYREQRESAKEVRKLNVMVDKIRDELEKIKEENVKTKT